MRTCSRCGWRTDVPYLLWDGTPLCPGCVLSLVALATTPLAPQPAPGDELAILLDRLERHLRGDIG